ncbi:MAG: hypothetical protein K2J74_02035 [Muribaculaceae bacterium]|nr:hypothetical protein [Muribaculaceae bacterium]
MKSLKSIYISIIAMIVLASTSLPAFSQGTELSPYSKYGYGMLTDGATGAQRAMGGVGYAMKGGRQINVMNPASYASIDSLTFLWDVGVSMVNYWGKEQGESANKTGGGLDYLTMQFPLGKRFGASVGLVPYSSVGYSFGSKIENGATSSQGTGGINQLFAGFSAKVFKGFNLGFNVGYMWGTIANDNYATASTGGVSLFERVMQIEDYSLNFGAQYSFMFKKNHEITLGATFAPGKNIHGNETAIYYDMNSDAVPDTALNASMKGKYSMPMTIGAGISYTFKKRLTVEVDYTYQPWKDAKFSSAEDFEQTTLDNRWKVALGAQYVHNSRGSYANRIVYRAGANYGNDYISVLGNQIKEYGVSVGLGLPAPGGSKTMINIGLAYKHRNTSPVSLVKEDYLTITLGINFNEMWFWKRRFE